MQIKKYKLNSSHWVCEVNTRSKKASNEHYYLFHSFNEAGISDDLTQQIFLSFSFCKEDKLFIYDVEVQ